MGRLSASLPVLALAAMAALGLAACGGGNGADLLPGGTASEITSNLDRVERLADEGDCSGASEAALAVSDQVEALDGVDAKLKQALREGATRLNEVVADCEEATTEETSPAIEPAEVPAEAAKKEKPEKPAKPKSEEKEEPEETATTPTVPPQAEGPEEGEEEAPPAESGAGSPSGGVGPAEPAGGE